MTQCSARRQSGWREGCRWRPGREPRAFSIGSSRASRPPGLEELRAKVEDCCGSLTEEVLGLDWRLAADFLRRVLT
jgi:hypothetical protein